MKGADVCSWTIPLFPVKFKDVKWNLVQYWRPEWVVVDGIIVQFLEVEDV